MKQLSGVDASFLHIEDSHRVTGHVASLIVVDPSTADGSITADVIRDFVAERIHLLPWLRLKLVTVPFGIDLPYWIDDPDLDLDFHVRGIGLPSPGDDRQLADQVSRLASRALDRAHPMWELYVIEGLRDGRVGIMTKVHHAAVDGKAGMRLLQTLLSTEKDAPPPPPPAKPLKGDPEPSELEMLGRGWLGVLSKPEQGWRLMMNLAKETPGFTKRLGSTSVNDLRDAATAATRAPRLPFNKSLSARRNWAFGTLSLPEVKAVKDAHGFTINDVVMAVCAGAMRRYLQDQEALPDEPLQAMVPVSVRTAEKADAIGNQVSGMIAPLPTDVADPVERLKAAHEAMRGAKEQYEAVPATLLQDFSQFAAPAASEFVARTAARFKWAERMPIPFNVVISNVPGPREPLYYAGALMEAIYPVSMITDGMGLNITVQSYRDRLDFGLVGTPELVPDIESIIEHLKTSLEELKPS
jgi:diacylglycerol O-acyltransferase